MEQSDGMQALPTQPGAAPGDGADTPVSQLRLWDTAPGDPDAPPAPPGAPHVVLDINTRERLADRDARDLLDMSLAPYARAVFKANILSLLKLLEKGGLPFRHACMIHAFIEARLDLDTGVVKVPVRGKPKRRKRNPPPDNLRRVANPLDTVRGLTAAKENGDPSDG